MKTFTTGDTIFFFDHFDNFQKDIIVRFVCPDENDTETVYLRTKRGFAVPLEQAWETEKEARAAYADDAQKQVETYKKEITSVQDLVVFLFHHCVNGEEYTDWNARAAAIQRAKKLLDIDLEKQP